MSDDKKYQSGNIMVDEKNKVIKCCRHKNLVPLEYGIATKTWPNGYKAEPNYNFAIGLLNANVVRVKTFICLDCRMEIKAPEPGHLKKDRL
jgi:hypothetical protein